MVLLNVSLVRLTSELTFERVVVRSRPKSHRQLAHCTINRPIWRYTRPKSVEHHQLFSSFAHQAATWAPTLPIPF